jgi:hypothetical protein
MTDIRAIRSDINATISVYRDEHYCGIVFCPTPGNPPEYLASPWTDAVVQRAFSDEIGAIDYLVREA